MNAVWQHGDTSAMPAAPEHPGAYDPRYVHEVNVYGGRTDVTPDFTDRNTTLMNAGLGPSRVPMNLGTIQLNDVQPTMTTMQGITATATGAVIPTQQSGNALRETGLPPAPVPVHEPSYFAPGEWWGR